MSLENYDKNKDRVNWLQQNKNQINDRDDISFRELIIEQTLFNEEFEVHCRGCRDLYIDTAGNILNRGMACKCGSWRIEVYEL
jgi:hypothetical protein